MSDRIALVGFPNCGKTAIFNRITTSYQKVANYPGVTVEPKHGFCRSCQTEIIDLPGLCSLDHISPDELITKNILQAKFQLNGIIYVINALNIELNLGLLYDLLSKCSVPIMTLAVTNVREAEKEGLSIDLNKLEEIMKIPVKMVQRNTCLDCPSMPKTIPFDVKTRSKKEFVEELKESITTFKAVKANQWVTWLDKICMHPVAGWFALVGLMFLAFQMIFLLGDMGKGWIENGLNSLFATITAPLESHAMLYSLLNDAIITSWVIILSFLPQIIILWLFLLIFEQSGYLPRVVLLADKVFRKYGLNGRSIVPMLSGFSCAIPSILSARYIQNPRERLSTIMAITLLPCSAQLPVYTLIISCCFPNTLIYNMSLQGLVLFGLYILNIISMLGLAFFIKITNKNPIYSTLMMEVPHWKIPYFKDIFSALWTETYAFVRKLKTLSSIIVVLWFLSHFPLAPAEAPHPDIYYSVVGMCGRALTLIFSYIGFNWQISTALIPGIIAREVMIISLNSVYAISDDSSLAEVVKNWHTATSISLLTWYAFAPQCLATILLMKKEIKSTRKIVFYTLGLFVCAFVASCITYNLCLML